MSTNQARREHLLDAGLAIIAEQGARGLTYREMDARAGVPPGTASNYFRNRAAMLNEMGARIFVRLQPEPETVERLSSWEPTIDLVRDSMRDIFRRMQEHRELYLALLELKIEAARRPDLREILTETLHADFVANVGFWKRAGLAGGAREVMLLHLAMDGLIVSQLTSPGALEINDVDETITLLVDRLIGQ